MKVFVTGSTGFVGKHLVPHLLRDGHALFLLVRDPVTVPAGWKKERKIKFLKGDIASIADFTSQIKKFHPEVCVHLAWEGIPSDVAALNIKNLEHGLATIKTCLSAGVRGFVMAGSCHEYGEPGGKVTEGSPLWPYSGLYEAKVALHWLGTRLTAEAGASMIWLRPGFIYGPGQRARALMPYLVDTLKRGEEPAIRTPNGGQDFIYIDDVADAFAKAVGKYKKIGTNAYNVGGGRVASVAEIMRYVYREFDVPVPRQFRRDPRKVRGMAGNAAFWMDISKAKRDLGWMPRTRLADGIKKTVVFFKNLEA